MGRKLLQKRVLAQKSSNKVNKKIAQPVKQPTTKLNSARIQSSNVKKQLPIKSNVTAKPSLRATPVLPRDFTRKPKQPTVATTPIKAPTAPVNTPFLKLPIAASLPRAATQKHQVNEPKVSAHPAKKIATFNKEKNAETVVAYSAIMSGLKAA